MKKTLLTIISLTLLVVCFCSCNKNSVNSSTDLFADNPSESETTTESKENNNKKEHKLGIENGSAYTKYDVPNDGVYLFGEKIDNDAEFNTRTLKELKETCGFEIKGLFLGEEYHSNFTLDAHSSIIIEVEKDNRVVLLDLVNNQDTTKSWLDCKVNGISDASYCEKTLTVKGYTIGDSISKEDALKDFPYCEAYDITNGWGFTKEIGDKRLRIICNENNVIDAISYEEIS